MFSQDFMGKKHLLEPLCFIGSRMGTLKGSNQCFCWCADPQVGGVLRLVYIQNILDLLL
jgi:hypothetical protein